MREDGRSQDRRGGDVLFFSFIILIMYPAFQKVVIQSGVILDLIQYILLCGKDSVARRTGCGRRRWLENDRQGARGKSPRRH